MAIAAALCVSTPAFADEEPVGEEVIVVTGTRTPEHASEAPVRVDVVSKEEAERRGATNVAEALATQPGVQVNPGAYGYLGGISAIQIQGFDLNRVLILEDGEPVIGDVGGGIDLATIGLADVDRIEIVTGPTSALYGSSAIGGVVNILTAPPKQGLSLRARSEVRSYRGVLDEAAAAYREGETWASADLTFARNDGQAATDDLPALALPRRMRTTLGLRAGIDHLQVRARWLHQQLEGRESMEYPGIGRFVNDLPESTDRYAVQAIGTVSYLRLAASLQRATDDSSTVPQGTTTMTSPHHTVATAPSGEAIATVPDGDRTWIAGARVEAEHLTQSFDGNDEVVPRWLWSAAAYGQLEWKLGDLRVVPGVRVEDHGDYGTVAAPRLALAYKLPAVTLRAAVGRGYRVPSAEELGFNFDHSIYGYKVVGNPDLRPEASWGINGDALVQLGEHVALRAGGFANWVSDLIDIDLAHGMTSGTVVTYTYANVARVRTAGGQGQLAVRAGAVELDAAYDYLWTRDDATDAPIAGMPAHTLTAAVRTHYLVDANLRVRVTGSAYVDDQVRSPGYTTVDARVAHALWRDVAGELGVTNLFDVRQTPGAVGDLRPPMGRVIYAGVTARLP